VRAENPTQTGQVVRDGVRIAYEVYGTNGPTLVLLPCWIIVHGRSWKAQIADLAQDCRLIVVEGRGNGASDRPAGAENYAEDALAVMDHLQVADCVLMGFSMGGPRAALIAQRRPDQVKAMVLIAPTGPLSPAEREARIKAFMTPRDSYEGGARFSAGYMRQDYAGFLRFFFRRMYLEKHSTKPFEDAVGWGLETNAEALIDSTVGALTGDADLAGAYAGLACPVLVIHGTADNVVPLATGLAVGELCRAEVLEIPGSGHGPHGRYPAVCNAAIRGFLQRCGVLAKPPSQRRGPSAPRALYLSSPIGLGHARRDLAVARALKAMKPGLQVEWLAQDPVTRMLASAGETLHPASARLASESRHIEDEAGEHDLNVFEALRRMDEILVRNFRVFQDAVESQRYDLVIADEGWEVDHFWHEHPQFKRAPLVWMTDFVGFAPMAEGGDPEAALTSDYNAEMVGHIEGQPGVRDRAIFVGNRDDVVDDALGPDLPGRRAWTEQRFGFSGYILGDDVPAAAEKAELRARLGLRPDETVCVVAVGGSGVGLPLIRRILAGLPAAQRARPGLRTIVVTGPRLSPEALPAMPGVEYRGFEPALPSLLAACDLALVQGGLSTCMELAATRTPFIYFPLQRHFEQNVHVVRRLESYGAGRRLAFAEATPEVIAAAMDEELARQPAWRDVERGGAARAAGMIAELL
jgi:pimeloyl-ACP methyl ester carboxylesterase/predicted glycosyltransferase